MGMFTSRNSHGDGSAFAFSVRLHLGSCSTTSRITSGAHANTTSSSFPGPSAITGRTSIALYFITAWSLMNVIHRRLINNDILKIL